MKINKTIYEAMSRAGIEKSLEAMSKFKVEKLNEDILKEYPIIDSIWPSRRWNREMTDYMDLSGHDDFNHFNESEL